MTSRDFCFWLQGFFERQTKIVKAHLALVFKHEIDPSFGNEEHQNTLNNIHDTGGGFRC